MSSFGGSSDRAGEEQQKMAFGEGDFHAPVKRGYGLANTVHGSHTLALPMLDCKSHVGILSIPKYPRAAYNRTSTALPLSSWRTSPLL
eukprot:902012-Pelagomonas_calceolata.AAC.3